ncbi:MAG: hypothetical protein OXH65_00670 [Paracoccaceae bacterium]|nr:hypothetical protein [Paracoccaceae bacterium]
MTGIRTTATTCGPSRKRASRPQSGNPLVGSMMPVCIFWNGVTNGYIPPLVMAWAVSVGSLMKPTIIPDTMAACRLASINELPSIDL